MGRKTVLFLITKATWGGAQHYAYDLATSLPKNEFEPVLAYGTEGKLARDLEAANVRTLRLPSLGRDVALLSDIKSFFEMRSVMRALKPDVIHLNSSKAALLGAVAARMGNWRSKHRAKIIFTVHGWPFKEKRNPLWRSIVYLLSWITALLSDATIVVSENDERSARRMWGVKTVSFIPLGTAPIRTLSPSEAFSRIFGTERPPELKSETCRILSIAELVPNKGIRHALSALAELSRRGVEYVYVVAGEGEERAALEAFAKESGVSDRVYFAGFVENASQYLSGFDVFLLPSLKEGTPYSLLEAGSVGIPMIATTVIDGSLKERFPKLRLVPPEDPYVLADAIAEVSRLPHAERANSALSSIPEMVEKTIALYRD